MTTRHLPTLPFKTILIVGLALTASGVFAQTANETELARRLDQLAAELANVKAQLAQLQRQPSAPTQSAPVATFGSTTPVTPTQADAAPAPAAPASPVAARPERDTVLTGYGEINYNRPTRASQNAQADVRRLVLGIEHRFDAKTKLATELEVEHAVTSSTDAGEVAIEQAYVEHQLTPTWALRAGLFLMPAGLLNENHEPTAYYGVERNFVETAIIPTTWREGGVQLIGNFDNGVTLQGGLSTSFDLNKWEPASGKGKESPLGSIHQELAQAKSHDIAAFGALNWRGVPGLLLGGSLFTGQATQAQAAVAARITLWDVHARWTPGRWDLSALYSRGTISNTAALNASLDGNPTPIPKAFDGYYVQGAYKVWSKADYALAPFVRWEQFNTASAYADLGPGRTPEAARAERVVTLGANLQVAQGVVVKADVQRSRLNPLLDRVDLGLGWSF